MALKALLLRRKIDDRKNLLAALREKDADFERREAEYAAAIEEVNAETSVEDRSALEAEINAFDQEMEEHRASAAALILFGIILVVTMINTQVSKKRVHY